jgi:hypothetical protein
MTSVLEKFTNSKIDYGRVLYRWDPFNTVNFHKYFDLIPNIMVVIVTKERYMVAGFTQDPFV